MAIALVDSDAVGFGVTPVGFTYNFPAGAPSALDLDVLCVNSDATVNTPAGWTLRESEVNQQGAYIFSRKGGAGASVLLQTSLSPGPFNAVMCWSRWTGTDAFDVSAGAQSPGGTVTTTPPVTTPALAQTGELVISYAALRSFLGAAPTAPSWSAGYTQAEIAVQGADAGATSVAGILGYKLNAGTAAESPVASWTGGCNNRYVLVATFTAAAVADTVTPNSVTLTTTLGEPTVSQDMTVVPDSVILPVVLGSPSVSGTPSPGRTDLVPALYEKLLECLCDGVAGNPNPPSICAPRVGTEVLYDMGQYTDQCCEGLAYIMLGDTYISSRSFPEQDIVQQIEATCAPPTWAQVFKVGIVRCISAGQPDGEPITEASWLEAARQGMYDSQSLRWAACCFRNWLVVQYGDLEDGMNVVINRQIQTNPQGGCIERYMTVTVQFPDIDCTCP